MNKYFANLWPWGAGSAAATNTFWMGVFADPVQTLLTICGFIVIGLTIRAKILEGRYWKRNSGPTGPKGQGAGHD